MVSPAGVTAAATALYATSSRPNTQRVKVSRLDGLHVMLYLESPLAPSSALDRPAAAFLVVAAFLERVVRRPALPAPQAQGGGHQSTPTCRGYSLAASCQISAMIILGIIIFLSVSYYTATSPQRRRRPGDMPSFVLAEQSFYGPPLPPPPDITIVLAGCQDEEAVKHALLCTRLCGNNHPFIPDDLYDTIFFPPY